MNKLNNYENIFRWMKKATKTERHIEELELFAKKHPIIFMKFHKEGNAIIKYDDPTQKLNSIEERLVSFISNNYKKAYRYHAEGRSDIYRLYLRLLLVTDYICGMTDSYAKRLYQELNAIMA